MSGKLAQKLPFLMSCLMLCQMACTMTCHISCPKSCLILCMMSCSEAYKTSYPMSCQMSYQMSCQILWMILINLCYMAQLFIFIFTFFAIEKMMELKLQIILLTKDFPWNSFYNFVVVQNFNCCFLILHNHCLTLFWLIFCDKNMIFFKTLF